uniref:Clp1 n=1 Tax=Flammulina velutipes TaxID=38945 RepID=A0A411DVJ2_FLAVE|nr:Clp1 [Flammulina velutipes]QPM99170.1 Clp1 protein [Flammulina velutipes]
MLNETRTPFRRRNFSNRIQHRWGQYKNPKTIAPGNLTVKRKQRKLKGGVSLKVKTYFTAPASSAQPENKQEAVVPVVLPRQLHRPDPATSDVVLPGIDAPPQFVRDTFADSGTTLLYALSTVRTHLDTASTPSPTLPSSVAVTYAEGVEPPTHVLAAFAPKTSSVSLFPVHDIVLTAHCHKLPPATFSSSPAILPAGHLPVRPFCIPHPASYGQLSQYLYTHRQDLLFASLCQPTKPPPFFSATPHTSTTPPLQLTKEAMLAFSRELSETFTQHKLLQSMSAIHGLWKNVFALGIQDDGLWEVLEVVWGVYLTAVGSSEADIADGAVLPSFGAEQT